jgi:membrane protease YdiL (CAAX protease family)
VVLVYTNPALLAKYFLLFLPLEALLDFGPDVLASILYRYAGIELSVLSIGGQRKRRYVVYVKSVPFLRSFESGLEQIVVTGLYYPLFEEMVFRGLPYLLGFGVIGVGLGTAIWVLLHPVWRLKMLPVNAETGTKIKMFTIDIVDYSIAGAWLSWLWLNGWGVLAVAYHIFHNFLVVAPQVLPEGFEWLGSKLKLPWPGESGEEKLPKNPVYVHSAHGLRGTRYIETPELCIAQDAYHYVKRED